MDLAADAASALVAGPRSDAAFIQRQALHGILSLTGREVLGKLLGLAGGIVLARLLEPAAFGLFAIANFAVALCAFLKDFGLAAALVQAPGDIERRDLDALFSFQLVVVAVLAGVLFWMAPLIAGWYRAPELTWLLRALVVFLVVRSLRIVPVLIAERSLDYRSVAMAEIIGQVGYWVVVVAAALAGLGVWSLVLGVTALATAEIAALFVRVNWQPALQFDWRPIRAHAGFGLMYKGQAAASLVRESLVPALGGFAYGSLAVGYLTWAQQLALVPLALHRVVVRVIYPALARLRGDREAFVETVEATLKWTCRISFPALAVLAGLGPEIIQFLYGAKWLPALPALYLLVADMTLGIGTDVLMTVLYAQDRRAQALKISAGWTMVTWLTAFGLMMAGVGFTGLAAAYTLGTALALIALVSALRGVFPRAIIRIALGPLASATGIGAVLYVTAPAFVHGVASLMLFAAAGGAAALLINVWAERSTALAALRSLGHRPGHEA